MSSEPSTRTTGKLPQSRHANEPSNDYRRCGGGRLSVFWNAQAANRGRRFQIRKDWAESSLEHPQMVTQADRGKARTGQGTAQGGEQVDNPIII